MSNADETFIEEVMGKLLTEFKPQQGPLFHYTNQEASTGIRSGEIWMTRADCFKDTKEIDHGINMLSEAAQVICSGSEQALLSDLSGMVTALRTRLKSCYVLSLSQNCNSDYLKSKYAGTGGAVLEFRNGFPRLFYHGSWHNIRDSIDSFHGHFIQDVYDLFNGFVVYDACHQRRILEMVCRTYRDWPFNDTTINRISFIGFIHTVMLCLVLFKSQKFDKEGEFRIAFVQRPTITESFDEPHPNKSCKRIIKVSISDSHAAAIRYRDL